MSQERIARVATSLLEHAGVTLSVKVEFSQSLCSNEIGALFVPQGKAATHIDVTVHAGPVLP